MVLSARLQSCMEPSLCMHFQKIYLSAILENSTDPGLQRTGGSVPGLFAVPSSYVLPPNFSMSTTEGVTSKGQL